MTQHCGGHSCRSPRISTLAPSIDFRIEVGTILSIEGQLLNAYIEPKFYEVAGGSIVTKEFDAWESAPRLRKNIQGYLRAARVAR